MVNQACSEGWSGYTCCLTLEMLPTGCFYHLQEERFVCRWRDTCYTPECAEQIRNGDIYANTYLRGQASKSKSCRFYKG